MRFGKWEASGKQRFITGDLADGKKLTVDVYNLGTEAGRQAAYQIVAGAPGITPQDVGDFNKAVMHIKSIWWPMGFTESGQERTWGKWRFHSNMLEAVYQAPNKAVRTLRVPFDTLRSQAEIESWLQKIAATDGIEPGDIKDFHKALEELGLVKE
jgi:hypothetical protein